MQYAMERVNLEDKTGGNRDIKPKGLSLKAADVTSASLQSVHLDFQGRSSSSSMSLKCKVHFLDQ